MNFSVHLDEPLAQRLNRAVKKSGKPRNALIREALTQWLEQHRAREWPATVRNFRGLKNAGRFEHGRKTLKPPRDPFDALSA
jgi:predicted transcriptional regulator